MSLQPQYSVCAIKMIVYSSSQIMHFNTIVLSRKMVKLMQFIILEVTQTTVAHGQTPPKRHAKFQAFQYHE